MPDTTQDPTTPDNPSALPSSPAAPAIKRDRAFRRSLIAKLPRIANTRWEIADTMNLFDEVSSVVELDSDTFLEPLERLAGADR